VAHIEAIGTGGVAALGVGVIVVLMVIGIVLGLLLTAVVVRVVIAVAVVVLAVLVWHQRSVIENDVNAHACKLNSTFFGLHVDPPDSVRQACAAKR
jgi:hypothetical protein